MMKIRHTMLLKFMSILPWSRPQEPYALAEGKASQKMPATVTTKCSSPPIHHLLRALVGITIISSLTLRPSTTHAQTESRSETTPFMTWDPPDEELIDAFIPSISVEQFGDSRNNLQSYRIQIFSDGRAIYHGLRNVQQLGEVRFNISRQQVLTIQSKFSEYKFWQTPQDQYSRGSGQAWLFIVRNDGKTRTMRTTGSNYGLLLLSVIEEEVNSSRWRCPYIDNRKEELCSFFDNAASERLNRFIKNELPKIIGSFK